MHNESRISLGGRFPINGHYLVERKKLKHVNETDLIETKIIESSSTYKLLFQLCNPFKNMCVAQTQNTYRGDDLRVL